ncbi:hypothetical protein Kpol_1053p26 [Vanderwaltozyma polyspora DSM 70294]|uniref:Uncharacterized protein n=1 Tax=Vanderwaltozyma polyspora (strain ATCC 22028 / DSM 70294 / BCRC 21397 / CBS 2163 / NBRC 10782 / NRRL Y-8283 / UCD 57-17) TaxID=436907 RepID=A7TN71_VANPO|nr:uncharacterized protein Kpol_1053p26 [Vanderwaltozyma polyspora DSM 70294]EDO16289.1 hypothetical protein Kpol_1053p26 [Vanderwaltozyma polyspora DSM 70294]
MAHIATVEREYSSVSKRRTSKSANGTVTIEVEREEHEEIKLCHFHELPDWQKDNEFILTGYVRETNSIKKCLRSLGCFNNESINIYSHLIAAISYFVVLLFYTDILCIPSFPSTTFVDYMVIDLYLLGAFTCLIGSSLFHCMKQHSESHSDMWSKVDYIGIICLITCSLISLLYYGYMDHFIYFKVFTVITLVLATICTICVLDQRFNSKNFRPIRAGFFILFSMSAVIPIGAGFSKFGFTEVLQRIQLRFVAWETFFYVVGALLYGFRIPETLYPGNFDLVGSSHQIFHIMVILGSVFHLKAVLGSYTFMHSNISSNSFTLSS